MSGDVGAAVAALGRRLLAEAAIDPGALMVPRADFERAIARAVFHGRELGHLGLLRVRHCRVCGCTGLNPCRPEPCWWVAPDLCSTCEPFTRAGA